MNKKLISLLGIFCFFTTMFSVVSAEIVNPDETYSDIINWSKRIDYDSSEEQITIKKDNLFFDDDIADYWLTENNCSEDLKNCWAHGETHFKMQGTLFDDLNFYKVIEEKLEEGRIRWYKVYIYTGDKNQTAWDWVCEDETDCSYEEIITPMPEWSLYRGELFEPEEYVKWKIEAEKSPHHTIDWIAVVFGNIEMTPWALWYGSGGQAWQNVTLISPEDNYTSLNKKVNFSCQANNNETEVESINLEFYDNGVWNSVFSAPMYSGFKVNSRSLLDSPSILDKVHDIKFSRDGKNLFVGYYNGGSILQRYCLSTPWDISSRSGCGSFNGAYYVDFSPDGMDMYAGSGTITHYILDSPYDIQSASSTGQSYNFGSYYGSFFISSDGTKAFSSSGSSGNEWVKQFSLSIPWDVSSASHEYTYDRGRDTSAIYFSDDGSRFFVFSEYRWDCFSLPTPWDMTSRSGCGWGGFGGNFEGASFSSDGSKMFLYDDSSNSLSEYSSISYFSDTSYNFTQNISDDTLWRCSACDIDGDCGNATTNRTINLDFPKIKLISPTGTFNMKNFNVWANITALGDLDYCYFNITAGDGIEISNKEIPNCNESVAVNVSSYADYQVNLFANTTTGISSTKSFSFSINVLQSVIQSFSSGGGGSIIVNEITKENETKTCEKLRTSALNAFANMKENGNTQNLMFDFINAFVEYLFCKSASSIYPM